ncbi:MAG: PPE domain-containing protein [Pseudonocardiaceae bacterium]
MGIGDFLGDVADGAQNFAGGVVDGAQSVAGTVVGGVQQFASDPIGTVAGVFGGGDPSGNDGGSSNWAAWGHEEIRSMLDNTVQPADIHEGARAWNELQTEAVDRVRGSTNELRNTVSAGWRGESAEAAIRSLTPVEEWANTLSAAMQNTSQLMDYSGSAADHAKAAVPPAQSHDWGQSLGSFAVAGGPGAVVDAVAQDRAQEEAWMEAVRIMHSAYSAPINESRVAVPVYPQLADPTLRPPEPSPFGGPSPGAGHAGPGAPGGGGGAAGGGGAGGGVSGGGAYQPSAVAGLQGAPRGSGFPGGAAPTPGQLGGARQPPGGPGGGGPGGGGPGADAAAAGIPLGPLGGAVAGGDAERRGFRGAGVGGGRPGGLGGLGGRAGSGSGGGPGFGPRGSGSGVVGAGEGRVGAGPGSGAGGAAGRGGVSGVPLAGAGAGRGQSGDDAEHRRPSYLIETDDIFGDGRKVAPPVIGEDPPEHYR